MELEAFIQTQLRKERAHFEISNNPIISKRLEALVSTIEKAPRTRDAIQAVMDAKEVAMNQVSDISELQQLDREWSALEWLKAVVRKAQEEGQKKEL
jgi:hypothetical protein